MRLVTKDLKCLESGNRTSDDLRRTTISHFCSLLLFAPSDPIETTRHVILPRHFLSFAFHSCS